LSGEDDKKSDKRKENGNAKENNNTIEEPDKNNQTQPKNAKTGYDCYKKSRSLLLTLISTSAWKKDLKELVFCIVLYCQEKYENGHSKNIAGSKENRHKKYIFKAVRHSVYI